MTETNITLSKLTVWNGNARKTNATDGINELAASIAAHGLLQPLLVTKALRGTYSIIAGQRRYLALRQLASEGKITADYLVPCRLVTGETDLTEISLAENVVRLAMHPADEFFAFRELADKGLHASEIAARFGVTETTVLKRMKLGRVSPTILDLYRQGELALNQVEAFTVSDDHARQEQVWHDLPAYNRHPSSIRLALTDGEIPLTEKRVKLVTVEAYEAAGGEVRRDLFDTRNGGYLMDATILDRLVREKLEAVAETVKAEGWKWVEIIPDFDYEQRSVYAQRRAHPVPLAEAAKIELDELQEKYDALADEYDGEDTEIEQNLESMLDRINELSDSALRFSDDTFAIGGAVISISYDGLNIDRGLIRGEDLPEDERRSAPRAKSKKDEPANGETLSAALVEDLSAYKTAAIRAELMDQPSIALASVVHALLLRMIPVYGERSCLEISSTSRPLTRSVPETNAAMEALAAAGQRWGDVLPGSGEALWDWCLSQSQEVLLDLLAFAVAQTVNAVQGKVDSPYGNGLAHAERLATALNMDMANWFTPTADNYFSRASKPLIIKAICEAKSRNPSPQWEKLKKAELAVMAEREVAGTGWLPEQLRGTKAASDLAQAA
jgi:ParB family chromosome partitioning protein